MTQKARALGMSRTTYVNASGLPDDDQITTARDLALLGRAIQERFPRYYRYFALREFVYHGVAMRNHNHLLGAVGGVDGIKTGYTRASGFNLVTSVHRDGRYIVAVVLGGRSAFERDAHMRELINAHIREASLHRTAPVLAERAEQRAESPPAAPAKSPQPANADPAPAAHADPMPTATLRAAVGSNDPIQPVLVKTVTYRTAPLQTASLAPMPALVPVTSPSPAERAAARAPAAIGTILRRVAYDRGGVIRTGRDCHRQQVRGCRERAGQSRAGKSRARQGSRTCQGLTGPGAKTEPAKTEPVKTVSNAEPETPPQSHMRSGWLIQVGAFEEEGEARQHLSAAQTRARPCSRPPIRSPSGYKKATKLSTARALSVSTSRRRKPPASCSSAARSSAWQ